MRYISVEEHLETPDLGSYVSYGIAGFSSSDLHAPAAVFVSDVSTDAVFVSRLADLCTSEQVHPDHLLDVIYNAL